jgi:hypothetical protein
MYPSPAFHAQATKLCFALCHRCFCPVEHVLMLFFVCRKAMSVLKVEYPDTMDETKTRVKIGGLLDPRLGTIGKSTKILTSNTDPRSL